MASLLGSSILMACWLIKMLMGPKNAALMPTLTSTSPVTHRAVTFAVGSASAAVEYSAPSPGFDKEPGSGAGPGSAAAGMSGRLMAGSPWTVSDKSQTIVGFMARLVIRQPNLRQRAARQPQNV
jgi:hypothetical protein